MGLVDACEALKVSCDETAEREIVAVRIIELARRGERSPAKLCDRCWLRQRAERAVETRKLGG